MKLVLDGHYWHACHMYIVSKQDFHRDMVINKELVLKAFSGQVKLAAWLMP